MQAIADSEVHSDATEVRLLRAKVECRPQPHNAAASENVPFEAEATTEEADESEVHLCVS